MAVELTTESKPRPFDKIAIIGLGLIGSSVAGAVRATWPETQILGVDVEERTLDIARDKRIVDYAIAPDDEMLRTYVLDGCDLVLLATSVDIMQPYFAKLREWGYRGLVSDTASTKRRVCELAVQELTSSQTFIPGHPMCGSEINGIDGYRPTMFQGSYWILCPDESTTGDSFQLMHEFVTGLGSRMISIPREQHDRAVAIVSHVPHLVASSLVALADHAADDQRMVMRLAAGGFKDTTRIASGSADLWTGIEFDNAHEVLTGIDEMCAILQSFAQALRDSDRAGMRELLAHAAKVRRTLPTAWLPSTERLLEVRIPMSDRKGVVAEVTTIASSVGCNIQSIEIDHITESKAVLSMILTDEGDIGKLSFELIDAGYSVSFSPLTAKE